MSEFKRLIDTSDQELTRQLLASGLPDGPPPETLQRAASALGLGTLTTAASGVFAAGAASQAPVASAATSPLAASTAAASGVAGAAKLATTTGSAKVAVTSSSLSLKWLFVGLIGGGAIAGMLQGKWLGDDSRSHAQSPAASLQTAARAMPQYIIPKSDIFAGPELAKPASTQPAAEPLPGLTLQARRALAEPKRERMVSAATKSQASSELKHESSDRKPPAAASKSRDNAEALQREVAMIDAAKLALASGNAMQSLRLLDEYLAKRRIGVFDREALILRIDALLKRGSVAEARSLAATYLNTYAKDTHAPRLERLVLGSENQQ